MQPYPANSMVEFREPQQSRLTYLSPPLSCTASTASYRSQNKCGFRAFDLQFWLDSDFWSMEQILSGMEAPLPLIYISAFFII